MEAHKNDDQMQNCNRLTLFDLRREKRPGNAYDVSVLELANNEVRSSTMLHSQLFGLGGLITFTLAKLKQKRDTSGNWELFANETNVKKTT